MKKIILCSLFSFMSLACTITGAEVVFTTVNNKLSSFNFDTCSNEQIDSFRDILQNSTGTLKEMMIRSNSTLSGVILTPKTIRIRSLEEAIMTRLNLSLSTQLKILDHNINAELLAHGEDDFLSVSCNNCEKSGAQNILVSKTSGPHKINQWLKVNILKSVRALVSKTTIGLDYSGINSNSVSLEQVFTDKPEEVFTDLDTISMYRANRVIQKNSIIRLSDISPLQLVKPGSSVKVKMNFDNLSVTTQAISIGGGYMGDEIKLKNEKTNKIFSARVIGINEVKLDL